MEQQRLAGDRSELARWSRSWLIGPVIREDVPGLRYAVAILIVLVVTSLRTALNPLLGANAPLLPLIPAILITAGLCGRNPALLACAFAPALQTVQLALAGHPIAWPAWLAHVTFFIAIAVTLTVLLHALQRAHRQQALLLEAARETERRKDEFLAMLGHELRNPLAPIRNIADILNGAGGVSPDRVRELGSILQRQARHLVRMVDDLLDVSRITRGAIELHMDLVQIETVIRDAKQMVEPALEARQQRIDTLAPAISPTVRGDATRLTQVIANLLANASKYSPSGGIIDLYVEPRDQHISIRVCDRGAGIDPQMLGSIFDLFVQADRSLDRRDSGLGVGLTLSKRLVELHGGTIEAHSAGLGAGAEFVVRLPRDVRTQEERTTEPAQPLAAESASAARRVLIVDDNVVAGTMLAMMLQLDGYDVQVVHDGREAFAALDAFPAEVVLLDIGLPDMDGYLVAQTIRERYPDRPLQLIAVTGYGGARDRELAFQSGFDGHLTKPVAQQQLLNALNDAAATARVKRLVVGG